MRQVAGIKSVTHHELAILGQFLRVGILVDTINRRYKPVLQLGRDRFIGGQHELLDQLMGLVVLDPLEPERSAGFSIDDDFHFREIEVERAVGKAPTAE